MSYATVTDMVKRFGVEEMIRASSTGEVVPVAPNEARIQVSLDDATAIVEGYLRARYVLPLSPVPREAVRAACIIARYDLNTGDGKMPTKEMVEDRDAIIAWLKDIASGAIRIDAPTLGATTGARVQDRCRELTGRGLP